MCQSQAQGGKRCAAHTRPFYQSVMADIAGEPVWGQTRADFDDDLAYRVDHGMDAIIDYAATKSGADEVRRDLAFLEQQYERHPSSSIKHETVRQGTLSALRVALRQAEARNDASGEARATLRQSSDRYNDLFHSRIDLQTRIHTRMQAVEDSADAHAVDELHAQLDAVNAEMESMETWRRAPAVQATSVTCWRSECRNGCYYPNVCSEARAAGLKGLKDSMRALSSLPFGGNGDALRAATKTGKPVTFDVLRTGDQIRVPAKFNDRADEFPEAINGTVLGFRRAEADDMGAHAYRGLLRSTTHQIRAVEIRTNDGTTLAIVVPPEAASANKRRFTLVSKADESGPDA